MELLDIFANNAFGTVSLTDAINKLPYVPSRLGELGLFRRKGVPTTRIAVEEKNGTISLLPTAERGATSTTRSRDKRTKRVFEACHIPHSTTILADDVQNVHAFGSSVNDSAGRLEAVADVVNEELQAMRQDHETTHEYHRVGAIKGQVLDADGVTVLYDLFQEFNITPPTQPFAFNTADIKQTCLQVVRTIRDALGNSPFSGIHCMASDGFFDALVGDPSVKLAFERYQENVFSRTQQSLVVGGFEFAGITFENYRGKVGNVDFISDDQARFFPLGVPGLFTMYDAPADYVEAVNTPGKPLYAKQERIKFDKGIEIETQSNPLTLCTRPGVLVQGFVF